MSDRESDPLAQMELTAAVGALVLMFGQLEWALGRTLLWLWGEPISVNPAADKLARMQWSQMLETVKRLAKSSSDALAVAEALADHDVDLLLGVRNYLIHGRMNTANAPRWYVSRTFRTGEGALISGTTEDLIGYQPQVRSLTRALERAMPSEYRRINYGLGPFGAGGPDNPTP